MAVSKEIHRDIRFSDRFNWNDERPEMGFLQINGKAKGITKIHIVIKTYDPTRTTLAEQRDDPDIPVYNIEKTQDFIFK